ncbi:acyl-CoA N-acyltransferase [Gymnopilus junonius]|uniref:Acyl-CoA N-acyltransferase n=1 Tax=Gymnopilus junonius TaxID=109634 RepID=A0A9P5TLB8_GYMJU|nr:acyl-CoA N-acyltransferase [Gymnopilus junonius]
MPQHEIVLESPWKRIRLVSPLPSDDEAVALCRTHPVTRRFLRFLPEHMTADEVRIRREARAKNERIIDLYIHYVEKEGTKRFAGMSGYFNIDDDHASCEAGIIVMPDFHGQQFATEVLHVLLQYAFEEKKFHRVTFETGANNEGMRGWLEKVAGARLEADRKEAWKLPDGTFADVKGYAILDWEWRDHVKGRLESRLNSFPIA